MVVRARLIVTAAYYYHEFMTTRFVAYLEENSFLKPRCQDG